MNDQLANELWTRYLDEELTARERAALKQSLGKRQDRREAFVDDFELDGMLRALGRIDATADDFVAQVAERLEDCGGHTTEFSLPPDFDSEEDTVLSNSARRTAPPPVPPPVVPDAANVHPQRVIDRNGEAARSLARPAILRKQALGHVIGVAALILVALVGTIAIVTSRNDDPITVDKDKQPPAAREVEQPDTDRVEVVDSPPSRAVDQPANKVKENGSPEKDSQPQQLVDRPKQTPDLGSVTGTDDPGQTLYPTPDTPDPRQSGHPHVFARLTKSLRPVWETEPQAELTGAPLYLESGLVEIAMNTGVVLTILGPADFELSAQDRMLLSRGRLNALVPATATGFTVETPASQVVDLGTEFDVSVDELGETAVRVHQGEVELSSLPADDAEPQKWNLTEGQFRSIQRDGTSHDFYLATSLDRSGRGTVSVNGIPFVIVDRRQLDVVRAIAIEQLAQAGQAVSDHDYSGVVNLDGSTVRFVNASQFRLVWRQVNQYFDRAGTLLDRVGSLSGSIIINGTEVRFNNFQDLMDQSEWLKRMGAGGWINGVGNLRELMRMQEEMMRRTPGGAAGADGKGESDVGGSINVNGQSVDFGNLEDLMRLGDSLRGGGGNDRRARMEEMRQRHEEIRKRTRERLQNATP